MVCWTDQTDVTNNHKVYRKTWTPSPGSWGSAVQLYDAGTTEPGPRAIPFWSGRAVCQGSNGTDLQYATGAGTTIMQGAGATSWACGCAASGEDAVVAAVWSDGSLKVKRMDTTAPPTSGVSVAGTPVGGSVYVKANFGITFSAIDDWNVTGTDVLGDAYTKGVTSIAMKYTDDPVAGPWNDLPTNKGAVLNNAPWTATVNVLGWGDGTWYIKGTLTDTAGNNKDVQSIPVVLDRSAPTVNVTTNPGPPGGNPDRWRNAATTVTVSAVDPNLSSLQYKVQAYDGSGPWQDYAAPFAAPQGQNMVIGRATDKAGNTTEESLNVYVDTSPPTEQIVEPSGDTLALSLDSNVVTVSGKVNDVANVASVSVQMDGKEIYHETEDGAPPNSVYFSTSWVTDGVTLGKHTMKIVGRDSGGHQTSVSKDFNLVENPGVDWYFAEGNTRSDFEEYVCVLNPGAKDAALTFDFMLENGAVVTKKSTLPASSRGTYQVEAMVPAGHDGVSLHLHADGQPVVAERPMYFNYHGKWTGGHDGMGANSLQKKFYFAEGTTRTQGNGGPFDEWLCFQNPGSSASNITVTYMPSSGSNIVKGYSMGPHSRLTVDVDRDVGPDRDVSTMVESTQPIAAERPMYFNYHGGITGGHIVSGAASPSSIWYFAEGNTQPGNTEYITIQNPNATAATVTMNFFVDRGGRKSATVSVPARARATYDVSQMGSPAIGQGHDVATTLTSSLPVVAERPMYFTYRSGGSSWTGGDDTLGATELGRCFYFAEGTTLAGFDEWITVYCKDANKVAYLVLVYPDGTRSSPNMYPFGIAQRQSINVNQLLKDLGKAPGDVSVEVVGDGDICCERSMYFNYKGQWDGGHVVCGYKSN